MATASAGVSKRGVFVRNNNSIRGFVPLPSSSAALLPLGADGSGNAAMKYVLFMDPVDLDIPARNNT